MIDDPVELQQRAAYLDALRAQGRPARFAGFVACLAGVLILVIGRYRLGGATWLLWSGAGRYRARLGPLRLCYRAAA